MKAFLVLMALFVFAAVAEARPVSRAKNRSAAKYGDLTWEQIKALQRSLRDQANSSRSRTSGSAHGLTREQQRAINEAILHQRILSGGR